MLYNAVAKKLWPGCKLNPAPATQSDYHLPRYGRVLWLAPGIHGIVDQEKTEDTPVSYWEIYRCDWFYRDGMVCRADFNLAAKSFTLQTLHEFVFGAPCKHRNGNLLDNRRSNLMPLGDFSNLDQPLAGTGFDQFSPPNPTGDRS